MTLTPLGQAAQDCWDADELAPCLAGRQDAAMLVDLLCACIALAEALRGILGPSVPFTIPAGFKAGDILRISSRGVELLR